MKHRWVPAISIAVASATALVTIGTSGIALARSSPASDCTSQSLSAMELSVAQTVNLTWARATAAAAIRMDPLLTANYLISNSSSTSVDIGLELLSASCSFDVRNVTVVYSATNGNVSASVKVVEHPSDNLVTEIAVDSVTTTTVGGSVDWTGYEFDQPSVPAYAAWYVPYITGNEGNHCGGGFYTYGTDPCEFLIWSGLANSAHGSTGLAQAGLELFMKCEWTLTGWHCPNSYTAWYEFLPADPYIVTLYNVSPGDFTNVLTYYSSANATYWLLVDDYSNGAYEAIAGPSGFMGAPHWGEFISEDPLTGSTNPPVPDFSSFTYSIGDPLAHVYACGINCLLHLTHQPYAYDPGIVDQTSLFYNQTYPPGGGNCVSFTCFTQSYG